LRLSLENIKIAGGAIWKGEVFLVKNSRLECEEKLIRWSARGGGKGGHSARGEGGCSARWNL